MAKLGEGDQRWIVKAAVVRFSRAMITSGAARSLFGFCAIVVYDLALALALVAPETRTVPRLAAARRLAPPPAASRMRRSLAR